MILAVDLGKTSCRAAAGGRGGGRTGARGARIGYRAHARASDAIEILACDALQRTNRTQRRGSDNVDGRDRSRDPNSACRCRVHRTGGSIRNR